MSDERIKFYAGITDPDWFAFLAERKPDEVNFWRPRNQNRFGAIRPGEYFLFKLRGAPFFVGGGVFAHHTALPLAIAWQTLGEKNGAADYRSFERLILGHREPSERGLPLGCTVIVQPFFWPRELWIPSRDEWSRGLQTGKVYDTAELYGRELWGEVQMRLEGAYSGSIVGVGTQPAARYGEPRLIRPRLGQGAFRIEVTDAYSRRCAFTGERTLPALQAGHIRPYAEEGPHEVSNGMLLRSDIHGLFDLGYLTVTPDYRIKVSRTIKEEYNNGLHYYALDGNSLAVVPKSLTLRPAREFLEWHNGIFKG